MVFIYNLIIIFACWRWEAVQAFPAVQSLCCGPAGLGFGGLSFCRAKTFYKAHSHFLISLQINGLPLLITGFWVKNVFFCCLPGDIEPVMCPWAAPVILFQKGPCRCPQHHTGSRRVVLWPVGNVFLYRSRRAQAFSKKYSFSLEPKPNSEGIAHTSWALFMYGPEQKNSAFWKWS